MSRLEFGYAILSSDPLSAIEQGVQAEKARFDTVWVPDHFVDVDGDKLEPWTVLAALSMKTKKIRLGSAVTDTQRSHPARTAHAVANLDIISRGRAILGIGAGESMNITPYGLPWDSPADRVVRLEEAIQVIKLLWSSSREQPVNFIGNCLQLNNAFLSQLPKQKPHPPIFVGAFSSKNALRVVGRQGDGWYSWLNTPDTFRRRWRTILAAAREAGRPTEKIQPASHIMVAFPRNSAEKDEAVRSAKAALVMERTLLAQFGHESPIAHYQRLGVQPNDITQIMKATSEVPDDIVDQTMAIGGVDEVEEKIDSLAKAGVRHFAVGDLLAPKNTLRTIKLLRRVIKHYN